MSASLRTCFHHQACSLCSHAAHLSSPNPTDCYSVLSPLRVAAGDTLRPLGWTHLHALPHQHLVAPMLPRPLRPWGWTRLHALPHQHPVAPMLPRPLRPRGWTRLHALPGGVAQGSTRPIPPRAHCLHWAQQSTRLTSRIAWRLFGVRFGVRLAQNLLIHHAWRAL